MSVKCCMCGDPATGRYCFLNWSEEVVDNPFCSHHSLEVWKQTIKSLSFMHGKASVNREFILRQSFQIGGSIPALPTNKIELLMKGTYIH